MRIDRKIIDGKVFVSLDDLLASIYGVASATLDIAEITGDKTLALQVQGIIELGKSLDESLAQIKIDNGLAMYR